MNKNKNIFLFLVLFLAVIVAGCDTSGLFAGNPGDPPITDPAPIGPPPGLTTHPPKVGSLIATADKNKVSLSWEDLSPNEDIFEVLRDGVKVGATDKNIAVWTDMQVVAGATYCYMIIAYNKEYKFVSEEKCATVPPNNFPIISSVSATSATVETGKSTKVSCQASDPDSDPLTYSWSVNANAGTFSGSGSTATWTAPTIAGTYTIQCSVSDGRVGTATGTTDITVVVPPPPKWKLPQDAQIRSLAVDQSTGEVYAAGITYGSFPGFTNAGASDVFLAKFNPDGTLAWAKQWGTVISEEIASIVIFDGNIFIHWASMGFTTWISRFDAIGNKIGSPLKYDNSSAIGAVDGTKIYLNNGIKIDYQGTVISWGPLLPWLNCSIENIFLRNGVEYYTGQSYVLTDVGGAEGYTAAIDNATGAIIWTSRWGKQSTTSGNKVIANSSGTYTFGKDLLVVRHDLSGNLLWTHQDADRMCSFTYHAVADDDAAYALGCDSITKITNDGTLAWPPISVVRSRSLAILNNVLFVVTDGSNVIYRYDALTGKQIP